MRFKLNCPSLGRILMPLICLTLALDALGARQLNGYGSLKDPSAVKSVVLIDSGLVASIPKGELVGSQIIEIDGKRDVIRQITSALKGLCDIDILRVISHGDAGSLRFGKHALNAAEINARSPEVAGWSQSLAAKADLMRH